MDFVNNPKYAGSSPESFRDGYSLPASYLGSAITEIVRRVGSTDGSAAIGFSGSGLNTFADGYALPASSVEGAITEITRRLGSTSGDLAIGALSFSTGKYFISGTDVDTQIKSLGTVSEEIGNILDATFSSFVVSGVQVTRIDSTHVNISSGEVSINGRLYSVSSSSLVHSGAGTHIIRIVETTPGTIVIEDAASDTLFMSSDSVSLAEFIESGSAFSYYVDFRRFGKNINREYITVGVNENADFSSLKSALAWVKKNNVTLSNNVPKEIKLISDITASASDTPYTIQENGTINGNGHTISWSDDNELFNSTFDNITVKNLNAIYTGSVLGSYANFIFIELNSSNLNNYNIINCNISSSTGDKIPYFIQYNHNGSSSVYVNNLQVKDCIAECTISAIFGESGSSYIAPENTIITNNHFYQSTFSTQAEPCVRLGSNSIISNNIIEGGYNSGISCHYAENILINNNLIKGGVGTSASSSTAIMSDGIKLLSNVSVQSNLIIIKANNIKGIIGYGIDLKNGYYGENCIVSNNIISNKYDTASFMTGIRGGEDSPILSNTIIYPGSGGAIVDSNYVIENTIIGLGASISSSYAIQVPSSITYGIISKNYIYNVKGAGVDCQSQPNLNIMNNIFIFGTNAAILNIGSYSLVSNNHIVGYATVTSNSVIKVASSSLSVIIIGNILKDSPENGIDCGNFTASSVVENIILGYGSASKNGIFNIGSNSIISNNIIKFFGNTTYYPIYLNVASVNNIISNNILSDFGVNTSIGIYIRGSYHSVVGNLLDTVPHSGITVSSYTNILNNIIVGSATATASENLITGSSDLNITNNYLKDSNNDGIYTSGSNVNISNNKIINPKGSGVTSIGTSYINNNFIYHADDNGIELQSSDSIANNNNIIVVANNGIKITHASVTVDNIILNGNFIDTVASENGILFDTNSGSNHFVLNNYIKNISTNLKSGISIDEDISESSFVNNYIDNTKNGIMFNSTSSTDIFISQNTITNCLNDAINSTGTRFSIVQNYIYTPVGNGIDHDGVNGYISANYITSPKYGITISGTSDYAQVVGNRIESASETGIDVSVSDYISVFGNYVYGTATSKMGVDLAGSANSLLVGNYIWGVSGTVSINIDTINTITASGNLSNTGNAPTGFVSGVNIDGYSCRYI